MNGFYLANPWGLLALAAIPAIVAIHFLQRRTTPVVVSTLFLIQPMLRPTTGGRVWSYLRSSWSLWLQILAALLLAFVLAQPRILARESTQQVVLVLDSSYSMRAFREGAIEAGRDVVEALAENAANTEWRVLSSDPLAPPIYAGTDREALVAALDRWEPVHGTLDPAEVLGFASRSAAGVAVVYISDHATDLPGGVTPVMVGEPLANVGFAGVTTDPVQDRWEVLIQNYHPLPQTRQFSTTNAEGVRSESRPVVLEANETLRLEGAFEGESITLHLEPDAFALDDQVPLMRPRLKPMRVDVRTEAPGFRELLGTLPGIVSAGDREAPVLIAGLSDPASPLPPGKGILHLDHGEGEAPLRTAPAYSTGHPLVEGLGWNGLLIADHPGLEPTDADTVLVWSGEKPLILLRQSDEQEWLIFNFDPARSNLDRLPEFVLLMSRFLERLRLEAPGTEMANFELRESLADHLPRRVPAEVIVDGDTSPLLLAPDLPGRFAVRQAGASSDESPLLQASAHFAESREADFQRATRGSELDSLVAEMRDRHRNVDFFSPLWLLLAIAAMLAAWAFSQRPTSA